MYSFISALLLGLALAPSGLWTSIQLKNTPQPTTLYQYTIQVNGKPNICGSVINRLNSGIFLAMITTIPNTSKRFVLLAQAQSYVQNTCDAIAPTLSNPPAK